MNAVIDTNILIDYLKGIDSASEELSLYQQPYISIITWIEIMVGSQSDEESHTLRRFLSRFQLVQVNASIAETAVKLRKAHKIRLPDAIIWASAQTTDRILVTRNTRDFSQSHPSVRVPYVL